MYHVFSNGCNSWIPSSTIPCISSSCIPRISNSCGAHALSSRRFMYFQIHATPQLKGWWSICFSFSWFLCFQPLKSMCLQLFDSGHPYLDIYVLPTPCSCLSITLYCLHLLMLDSCATLDVVFTRVVYGAATEPRAPRVRPSLGCVTRCALVSRRAKA